MGTLATIWLLLGAVVVLFRVVLRPGYASRGINTSSWQNIRFCQCGVAFFSFQSAPVKAPATMRTAMVYAG